MLNQTACRRCDERPHVSSATMLVLSAALAGCATTEFVTPVVGGGARTDCRIPGKVLFDGNREYLPPVLVDAAGGTPLVTYTYSYTQQFSLDQVAPALQLVNPLSLFGLPTGSNSLSVAARLDVGRDGTVVRSYAAVVALKRSGSLFGEGETFSELRRKALLRARENISAQLCVDLPNLESLLRPGEPAPPADGSPR